MMSTTTDRIPSRLAQPCRHRLGACTGRKVLSKMGLVWMKIDPYPPWKPYQPMEPWIVFPESNVRNAAAPRCKPRPAGLNYDEIYDLLRQAGTHEWEYWAHKHRRIRKTSRQLRYMLRSRLPECIRSMTPRELPPGWIPDPDPYCLAGRTALGPISRRWSTLGPEMLTGPSA